MSTQTKPDYPLLAAVISAGAMIAFQIGGKAARDALFLSTFPVTTLPGVVAAAAAFSVAVALAASRTMSTRGPGTVMPYAFSLSSIFLIAEWLASAAAPKVVAILFYFHMASFGAVLVSGFWSLIGELYDPRAAKAKIGRIAAAGTVGGIVGGVMAERIGALLSASAMLPVLAALHLLCAVLVLQLKAGTTAHNSPSNSHTTAVSGFKVLSTVPYLKNLACLVLLGTITETLLDYVLKTQAVGRYGRGGELIRFFGLFYTGISVVTFLLQSTLSRYSLQRFGLAGTLSTMPLLVVAGGLGSLISPGLYPIALARGGQSILRSSLFRSAYELLYSPVSRDEKRSAKTIIDVGFDRLGDVLGGGLIRIVLGLGIAASLNNRVLIAAAVLLGSLSLLLTRRLGSGYITTLEKSLLDQAIDMDLLDVDEKTTRATVLRTLGGIDAVKPRSAENLPPTALSPAHSSRSEVKVDPWIQWIIDVRAEDPVVVRSALRGTISLDSLSIAPIIRLLARDDLSEDAVKALQRVAPFAIGQLTDALLNADEDFAVRRRVPRVLASCVSPRTVDGLLRGLRDSRFEVRFNCGRALSRICTVNEALRPEPDIVYAASIEEIRIAERLTEAPRIIDQYEDQFDSMQETIWNSPDIRLQHIFRLLSLCLPREPLYVAFQALHTDDIYLRGTALEYLERILPSGLRVQIWKLLEGPSRDPAPARPLDLVMQELMKSRHLIRPRIAPGLQTQMK